jgi:hypothetical protein
MSGRHVLARGITGEGRPLRFLMIVVGGWTGARVALLWPDPVAERAIAARRLITASSPPIGVTAPVGAPTAAVIPHLSNSERVATIHLIDTIGRVPAARLQIAAAAPPPNPLTAAAAPPPAPVIAAASSPAIVPRAARVDAAQPVAIALPQPARWSASVWGLIRGSGAAGGVATPQLGGSQVGARLAFRLDQSGRVAAVARVAAALRTRQQEAALGVEWQPTRLPLRLVAEQRIGIAGIRGGPALGLVGGVGALPLGHDLRVDGYAQAGVVARDRADGYVDGALVIARPVRVAEATRIELGIGAWGAAQRGASRLDLGPSATLVLPLERRAIRVGVQWRERVAGNARPGSGAVLSLGTDF